MREIEEEEEEFPLTVAARAQVAHKGFETERVYYGRVAVSSGSASHHGHHRGHLL
jgi:hypothetical protein